MAQTVKNLRAVQETQVQFLGWEDPLEKRVAAHTSIHPMEKGMVTHTSILAWRIPRTEETGGLQSMGSQRVGPD